MDSSASASNSLDSTFNSSPRPVARETSSQTTRELRQNLQRALCTLKRRTGAIAPAVLCVSELEGQLLPLIITTHIDLPNTSPNDLCDAVLNFRALKADTGISISLRLNSVLGIWGDRHINFTVVWLSNDAADECRSIGAHFLKVGTPIDDEEVSLKFQT